MLQAIRDYRYDPFCVDADGNAIGEPNIIAWLKAIFSVIGGAR